MEKNWFNKEVKDVETELNTNLKNGLSSIQLEENRAKYGKNELKEKKKEPLIKKFIEQFKDFSIIVLIIAAIAMGYRNFIQEQEARPKIEGKVEKNQEEK